MASLMELVRADWAANPRNVKAWIVLSLFRVAHAIATQKRRRPLLWWLGVPYLIFYRVLVEWFLCVEIPAKTTIGPGLILDHGQALVINDHTVLGKGCHLRHSTTIGCVTLPDGSQGPSPVIGDFVEIGSNVVILGGIRIGDGAKIGAGSVVVHDVAPGSVVVGNPARAIRAAAVCNRSEAPLS